MFCRKLKKVNTELLEKLEKLEAENKALANENQSLKTSMDDIVSAYSSSTVKSNTLSEVQALWGRSNDALSSIKNKLISSSSYLENESTKLSDASSLFDQTIFILEKVSKDLVTIDSDAQDSFASVQGLNDEVKEITNFVGMIQNISEQTNLLALNAAIEAARAGESGRGFAVVADEVRNLAQKSADATKDITQLVETITQSSDKTHGSIESISELSRSNKETTDMIYQTIKEVVSLAKHMQGVIANAASGSFIETLKLDHVSWKSEIYQIVIGSSKLENTQIEEDIQASHFGQWYYDSKTQQIYGDFTAFSKLESAYNRLHESGLSAINSSNQQSDKKDLSNLDKMEQASKDILSLLDNLSDEISEKGINFSGSEGDASGEADLF